MNFRLRPSPRTPWKGSPAIQAGNTTATLLAKLEQQFTSEASLKPARVLSIGVSPEQRKDVVDSIAAGGIVAFPQSRMGNESKALSTGAVGGEYSEAGVDLFGQLSAVICTMLGVPSDLILPGGSDTSSKESFRRFALSTVIPLLQTVMGEFERLVGPMTFDLAKLRASDAVSIARATGSKARAVSELVQSGMPLSEALSVAGID